MGSPWKAWVPEWSREPHMTSQPAAPDSQKRPPKPIPQNGECSLAHALLPTCLATHHGSCAARLPTAGVACAGAGAGGGAGGGAGRGRAPRSRGVARHPRPGAPSGRGCWGGACGGRGGGGGGGAWGRGGDDAGRVSQGGAAEVGVDVVVKGEGNRDGRRWVGSRWWGAGGQQQCIKMAGAQAHRSPCACTAPPPPCSEVLPTTSCHGNACAACARTQLGMPWHRGVIMRALPSTRPQRRGSTNPSPPSPLLMKRVARTCTARAAGLEGRCPPGCPAATP